MTTQRNIQTSIFLFERTELIVKTYMYRRDDESEVKTLVYNEDENQLANVLYMWYLQDRDMELERIEYDSAEDTEENEELRKEIKQIRAERNSWQRIEILPGVRRIKVKAFSSCKNVEEVIFVEEEGAQSQLTSISKYAFYDTPNLKTIKLPRGTRFDIWPFAFANSGLTSLFIPLNCYHIMPAAFICCYHLRIVHIDHNSRIRPADPRLHRDAIFKHCNALMTEAMKQSLTDPDWLRDTIVLNNHRGPTHAAFQLCCRENVTLQQILDKWNEKGGRYFRRKDKFGVSALEYLHANPYKDPAITENRIMRNFVLGNLGEEFLT